MNIRFYFLIFLFQTILCTNESAFCFGSLEIIGTMKAYVGEKLKFQTQLITPDGEILPSEFNKKVKWSSNTIGLIFNNETGFWEINATMPGRLEIIINADDKQRTHTVYIYEKVIPKIKNITMFVGEKFLLEFENNIQEISSHSSDPEIVTLENDMIIALKPGKIEVACNFFGNPPESKVIITVQVVEAKKLILACNKTNLKTGDPVYVGSYVRIVPYIETNIGLLPPKIINWEIDGNDNWKLLYDNSIIIKGDIEGTVIVTAHSINNLINITRIYFDHKLQLINKDPINIPLGTTYDLTPVNNNKTYEYKIISYDLLSTNHNVTISRIGQIYAGSEGQYIVIVKYRTQWLTIPLTITKPSMLFLESEDARILHPRVLDPNYQEYSSFTNSAASFNPAFFYVNNAGHYNFDVPFENDKKTVHINSNISVYPLQKSHNYITAPLWTVSHSALLFPSKGIYPVNPIVFKGDQIHFQCQDPQPNYMSSNKNVATITQFGFLKANKEGKTVIKCNKNIETTVVVAKVKSVSLRKVDDYLYKIETNFIPKDVKNSNLENESNFSYRCKWDAEECGKAQHIVENGAHYCKLTRFDRFLCPSYSKLAVCVAQPKFGIEIYETEMVFIKRSYFLVDPIIHVGIPPNLSFMEFYIDTIDKKNFPKNISYELSRGLNILFFKDTKKRSNVKFQFSKNFKGGYAIFEHTVYPKERIIFKFRQDKFYWIHSSNLSCYEYTLVFSIILIFINTICLFFIN